MSKYGQFSLHPRKVESVNVADGAASVAARVAREAYGRLVAVLSVRFRDVAAAEDALGDAFSEALARWPHAGVPASPEAWLLTVAKNQLRQGARHRTMAANPRGRHSRVHDGERLEPWENRGLGGHDL